jgi:hypothetical protein
MKVNALSAMVFGGLVLAGSTVAMAETAPAAPPAPAPTDPAAPPAVAPTDPATTPPPIATASGGTEATAGDSKMRLAVMLVPMPLGSLKTNLGGTESSADSAVAFAVMPVFDYLVLPNLFVGVAPSYAFNVKAKDGGGDALSQIDLLLRVGGGYPLNEKLQLYGYGAPGYSIIRPSEGDSAKGLVLGLHAGAMFDVASKVFLSGELGYQLGFQKVSDTDLKTNYLQIGLGVGMRI